MTEWREVAIGSVLLEFHDGPHATPPPAAEGPIFLGIKNITEDGRLDLNETRHISETDFDRWTRRVTPREDDIVFTYEATLHRYARISAGFHGCLGRRLALVRPDPVQVDARFLHFAMLGPQWRRQMEAATVRGATVDRLPLIGFQDFTIRLPDLAYQHRAADVLSAFDELIENNRRRIALLDETSRRLYHDWFVSLRAPGHDPTDCVETETGLIPKSWELSRLGNALEFVMGQSPSSAHYNFEESGLPFHQGVGSYGRRYPLHHRWTTQWSREAEAGDTLISVRAPVGRLNVADRKLALGRGLAAIRPRDGLRSYWFEALRHIFRDEDSFGGGTVFKAVTRDDLLRIPHVLPDEEARRTFDDLIRPLADLDLELDHQQRILGHARQLFLPGIVTGRVNVDTLDVDAIFDWSQQSTAPTAVP